MHGSSPLNTEPAMTKIEDHNRLVFIVDLKSNERQMADDDVLGIARKVRMYSSLMIWRLMRGAASSIRLAGRAAV